MIPLESSFQKRVLKRLNSIPHLFVFKKEAMALRGLPDLVGAYRGRFFAFELKRSEKEAKKITGRIALQKHIINQIKEAGGVAEIVYPENFEEKLKELINQQP